MMIFSLVLLSAAAVLAEPEAPFRRVAVAAPTAPELAYVAAPLVVGSQRAAPALSAPAAALLAYTAPAAPVQQVQQQYVARTYNGITTVALEQQQPVAAPLIAAPAAPAAPARFVVTNAPAAPARVVVAEAQPAAVRYYAPEAFAVPAAAPAAAPAGRIVTVNADGSAARFVAVAPEAPAAPAAAVFAVAPEAAPLSSSTQYFSRNFNGVPTVTYFVVGPAPAPVAVAPQQGAGPARRPARPGTNPVPAGEPVNQGDVEVLDA
ncbi:transcription initiation factor TFIID subunit 4-like [Thrips palmi]|uniref:Transcription initiation factor TFIID subunit 4-like n=1 Tax=Thrips palmi TaxID=161013 RepID=A0A6P8ZYA0_THRPL|nr:transcription initiation factor TFIID subunit 4-like [Thrips palmi]